MSSGLLALGNSWYFIGRCPGEHGITGDRVCGDEGASRVK